MTDTILVTGASGHLGRRVIHHLLESQKVEPGRIIAASRDPGKLADLADRGIETRAVDFNDEAAMAGAFAGANRILLISTDAIDGEGTRLRQHKAAVSAAVTAGVSRIAYTSMPDPEPGNPVLFAPDHYGTEQAIKASGLDFTLFRNNWYQENLLQALPSALATGKWYTSAGDGRTAHASRDDMAAAIAAGLVSDDAPETTYTLTGPKALSTDEVATLASAAAGRPLEVVQLPDDALLEGLEAAGLPAPIAAMLVSFDANARAGGLDTVTSDIETLSGRRPKPLDRFFDENKSALAS